jgi:hypothetical protein
VPKLRKASLAARLNTDYRAMVLGSVGVSDSFGNIEVGKPRNDEQSYRESAE